MSITAVIPGLSVTSSFFFCMHTSAAAAKRRGEAWFKHLPGKDDRLWWAILGLSVFHGLSLRACCVWLLIWPLKPVNRKRRCS